MTIEKLSNLLTGYRFHFVSEKDLQNGIETILTQAGIPYHRETALSAPDRPDFIIEDGIALEVKIKGSLADLLRQASRYAEHAEVTGILVVGTPHWFSRVPATLSGKPVRALRLLGSLL